MPDKTMLQKVSEETMRFMRGNYALDEIGDGKDKLKFRKSGKTVLNIHICEDCYKFLLVFGKQEREKFEAARDTFPKAITDIYDNSKTFHDGKWMWFPVADLETLEAVKRLILIKKKPNRKPFPTVNALRSRCGHRCDLCVHFTGGTISEEQRRDLKERLERVYQAGYWGDDMRLCPGCYDQCDDVPCEQNQCAVKKGVVKCTVCGDYPCDKAPIVRCGIEPKSILADDVTWAVLPFVYEQYGN
jgi:hypothetical protein